MGAWATGNLENDSAMDLLGALAEEGHADGDAAAVEGALREAADADAGDYLDADIGSDALAAGEIVAAAAGAPVADAGESAREYLAAIAARSPQLAALAPLATQAADRVTAAPSELRDLWDETGELDGWLATVDDLRARLRTD